MKNEPVKGYVNENEIVLFDKNEESLWFIEKISKKRRVKGKLQYFVRWEGFPKSFDRWIDASEVKEK